MAPLGPFLMAYFLDIGFRYLRSKKRSTVSVITFIAVTGVALGVAALLSVLSITSGFQEVVRDKVLGVNAHVLVLKYGRDFDEYRDVIKRAEELPGVSAAAPFVINEMMLAKGDRLSGVLVKGVDPERMGKVLDLPSQVVAGSLDGLRLPGAEPPLRPDQLGSDEGLDEMLKDLATGEPGPDLPLPDPDELTPAIEEALKKRLDERNGGPLFESEEDLAILGPAKEKPPAPTADEPATEGKTDKPIPEVDVPSPEEVERQLAAMDEAALGLPDEDWEGELVDREMALDKAPDEGTRLPGIAVGKTLAETLGIAIGDRVKVVSPLSGIDVSAWAPEARIPTSRDFRVIAVFEAGFQEYDTRLVYVDVYEAQRFYDAGDSVTGVEMRMHDYRHARDVARLLEQELGGPFHTMDWAELNHNLFKALEIQQIMLSIAIASIIIVAAFNVVATLIMLVLEKKREIAILKAMGATDSAILGIFLVQGAVIGVMGTLLGLALGGGVVAYLTTYQFTLDPKVYLIDHLPVVASATEFVITAAVALLICLIATLIPSWWAARLLPVEGVRYE